jgi:hypothetical protein
VLSIDLLTTHVDSIRGVLMRSIFAIQNATEQQRKTFESSKLKMRSLRDQG